MTYIVNVKTLWNHLSLINQLNHTEGVEISMKIVFISNFLSLHQLSFCDYLSGLCDLSFISTTKSDHEKKHYIKIERDYEINIYDQRKECENRIKEANIIIHGSAPNILLLKYNLKNKIVFRYSERLYKKGYKRKIHDFISVIINQIPFQRKNIYMLCASAYTSADLNRFLPLYKKRLLKWGYFPITSKKYLVKNINEINMIYVARFINWKHPEVVLQLAKRLKKNGYEFNLNMVGTGPLLDECQKYVITNHLDDCVNFYGLINNEEVMNLYKKSHICLFTSDFNEGWGAVVNEAMSFGCVVIASHAIGSVPYLIENGKNGYIYKNGDSNELFLMVSQLLKNKELINRIGKNAFDSINSLWNERIAANRLLEFSNNYFNKTIKIYKTGPLSKAEILENDWIDY